MLREQGRFGSCDPCWEGRCQRNVEEAHLSPFGIWRVQEGSREEGTPELKPKLQFASWSVHGGASGRRHHMGKGVEGSPWRCPWGPTSRSQLFQAGLEILASYGVCILLSASGVPAEGPSPSTTHALTPVIVEGASVSHPSSPHFPHRLRVIFKTTSKALQAS